MWSPPLVTLPADAWLPSPCVGVCQTDAVTGWCGGCGRSEAELAGWGELPAFRQLAIWSDLPRRTSLLGLCYRLIPLTGAALIHFLAERTLALGALWSMGVPGACLQLAAAADPAAISVENATLVLHGSDGRVMIRLPPGARAFELLDAADRTERLVLALHRARLKMLPVPVPGLAPCGPDLDAILARHRAARLFDLGLARRAGRLCIRTGDPAHIELLNGLAGADLLGGEVLAEVLANRSSACVVVSPYGRIEIDGPLGHGPQIGLDKELLQAGRDLQEGLELPPDYLPCAQLSLDGHPATELPAR